MAPDPHGHTLRVSDGHGGWTHINPGTPLPPLPPHDPTPTDRINTCANRMTRFDGHLVDPAGTGKGRWLATPLGIWRDDGITTDRREYLR